MTTRILDVAASSILHRKQSSSVIDDLLWMGVLKSLHGLSMYRRHHGPKVIAEDVVQFALTHQQFPYAVSHSMKEISKVLKALKNAKDSISITQSILRKLDRIDCATLMAEISPNKSLHSFLDKLQSDLIRLNRSINQTWFEFKHAK